MILFFGACVLSFINSSDLLKSLARLERLLRILAFIPIFLYVRKTGVELLKPLTYGFIASGYAIFVSNLLTSAGGRANGGYNPILFGDFASLTSAILLTIVLQDKQSATLKLITLGSLALSLISLVDSGTRGAWAGFVVAVFVIFILSLLKSEGFQTLLKRLALPLLVIFVLLNFSTVNIKIQSGIATATQEVGGYLSGTNPHTSLGYRFQMWEAAVKMWEKNPFIGSGLGDYSRDLAAMMQSGETGITAHFGEGHSLFFEFLATTGTFGILLCIISLFFLPAMIAVRAIRESQTTPKAACFLLVIVVSFFTFGLTQNWLGRSSITSTYLLLLAILLGSTRQFRSSSRSCQQC
jgi:O-antigen ligase